ncbi:MAG: hypothetical protein H0U85_05710 [Gemmatimonadales bacterium]|nr:hypothetical protein [Gemmatimonadales bacterium]MBA3689677.1 hypothetical protein [Chloroflexota bacterium]
MCLNCGCHKAHDDHENAANITYEDVKAAAEANKMGVAESLMMMLETAEEDRRDHTSEFETGEHSILRAGQGKGGA